MAKIYDMVVIGGGPAGYTAALYAARAGMDVLVLEQLSAGGQMALSHKIDNYPGFEEGIDGFSLGMKMQQGAENAGAKTEYAQVLKLDLKANPKRIETSEGEFLARTVAYGAGAGPKELGLSREKELIGRGVAYCAACDGMFYRDKVVAVVGGGNSAAADALLLSRVAKKVYLIHRRDRLRADKVYHGQLEKAENLEFIWNSRVEELLCGEKLTGIRIRNLENENLSQLDVDGIFISVGRKPATELVRGQLELDGQGYILAGESTKTNIPGVYAIGDVRTKELRQIVTAVADGAVAVHHAQQELERMVAEA